MLWAIIVLIVAGFIAGLIARALVPGDDSMSLLKTTILGVVGSFVGGAIGYLLFGADINEGAVQTSGLIGSIVGAMIALVVYRVTVEKRPAFG